MATFKLTIIPVTTGVRWKNITELGCWTHARRKYVDAQKATTSKGKKIKAGKASVAIKLIGKLYSIERQIRD